MDTRKWHNTLTVLPKDEAKVYYFTKSHVLLKGTYHYIKSNYSNPHKFNNPIQGLVDADSVSHWMEYDHRYSEVLPLPPDYIQPEEIEIEADSQQLTFASSLPSGWYDI